METSDPIKDKSKDTVGFFVQGKTEYLTKCFLTILKLLSLRLRVYV